MDLIKEAAKINQEGATFISRGDFQGGLESFRRCLRVLLAGTANINNFPQPLNPQHATTRGILLRRLSSKEKNDAEDANDGNDGQAGAPNSPSTDNNNGSPYYIHQEPIVFEPSPENNAVTSVTVALFCAVVEYNLALTFHLKSLTTGMNRTRLVTKSIRLYEISMEHASQARMDYTDDASNILLATLNNKTQIYIQEMIDVVPRRQLDWSLDSLVEVIDHCRLENQQQQQQPGGGGEGGGIFSDKEVEEFQLNITIFREQKFSAAA